MLYLEVGSFALLQQLLSLLLLLLCHNLTCWLSPS
jgi:hypothetical protein